MKTDSDSGCEAPDDAFVKRLGFVKETSFPTSARFDNGVVCNYNYKRAIPLAFPLEST